MESVLMKKKISRFLAIANRRRVTEEVRAAFVTLWQSDQQTLFDLLQSSNITVHQRKCIMALLHEHRHESDTSVITLLAKCANHLDYSREEREFGITLAAAAVQSDLQKLSQETTAPLLGEMRRFLETYQAEVHENVVFLLKSAISELEILSVNC